MKKEKKPNEELLPETEGEESPRSAVVVSGEAKSALKKDIRYRGPFSYRWLRLFGWLSFAIGQIGTILSIAAVFGAADKNGILLPREILSVVGTLMMPFFLLANFSLILKERTSYKRILLFHLGMTLVFAAGFYILADRYMAAMVAIITETPEEQATMLEVLLYSMSGGVNVFLDLLLCSAFAFFLNYVPKKFFQGKKIYIFRCFAILVVLYEATSFTLKILLAVGTIFIPHYIYPWLTCKPPVIFLAFVTIALFMKIREKLFIRRGGTKEGYEQFLLTNRNSLHVSVFTAIVFFIAALIDAGVLLVLSLSFVDPELGEAGFTIAYSTFSFTGLGRGTSLIFMVPVCLLFSYTREHKNKMIDTFLPFVGIGLTGLVFIEGFYFILTHLPK